MHSLIHGEKMSNYDSDERNIERKASIVDTIGMGLENQATYAMTSWQAAIRDAKEARNNYTPIKNEKSLDERVRQYVEKTLPWYVDNVKRYVRVVVPGGASKTKADYADSIIKTIEMETGRLFDQISDDRDTETRELTAYLEEGIENTEMEIDMLKQETNKIASIGVMMPKRTKSTELTSIPDDLVIAYS